MFVKDTHLFTFINRGRSVCFLLHLGSTHGHLNSPPPCPPPCFSKHLCRRGPVPPVTRGYRMRPSVLRCVQLLLLRSLGLRFTAPLDVKELMALWSCSSSLCPIPGHLCLSHDSRSAQRLDWEPRLWDCRVLGTGHTGGFVLQLNCNLHVF